MIEFLELYDELFLNFTSGLAALIVSTVAIIGLNTWRQQIRGKSEYELARRLIRGIYELRNAIFSVRLPHRKADWDAYKKPLERMNDAVEQINLELLEAEAIWGKDIVDKVNRVKSFSTDLLISLSRVFDENFCERQFEDKEKIYSIIYEGAGSEKRDEFYEEFINSIEEVEIYLQPYLKLK